MMRPSLLCVGFSTAAYTVCGGAWGTPVWSTAAAFLFGSAAAALALLPHLKDYK